MPVKQSDLDCSLFQKQIFGATRKNLSTYPVLNNVKKDGNTKCFCLFAVDSRHLLVHEISFTNNILHVPKRLILTFTTCEIFGFDLAQLDLKKIKN